ncbi:hypothetical protein Pmani_017423 [Petrolisthes manimaculis]|uniref:NACHT domain-containing protein n=1 Tax=Petrolisthes manimaculis TaxID=1843537 RepID=A0AAE1U9V8_9EUCA|nr:hypothetical protein Pmani_017423 [Petrolisthes manimaculis]
MGDRDEEGVEKRFRLGRALKLVAKEVLLQLYKERFADVNPVRATPLDMMHRTSGGRAATSTNSMLKKIIKANKEKKFDLTVLFNLLKYTCGLNKREAVWNDNNKLEGNITIVHQLRNEDAHWTLQACKGDPYEDWIRLTSALTNILRLSGHEDQIPTTLEKLKKIREGRRGIIPGNIQDDIRQKLVKMYQGRKKTTLKPLVWAGDEFQFHHNALDTFTSIRITTVDKVNQREEIEVDVQDVLERGPSGGRRVVVLEGETGTGKTSLLRYYAASWANDTHSNIPVVDCLQYVLLTDLTAAAKGAYSANDVIRELLPDVFSNWGSEPIFKELAKAGADVLFMIDAYDERYMAYQDAFKELLRKCPEATFLVVTRPHRTQFILRACEEPVRVLTAHGFGRREAVEYATKLLKMHHKEADLEDFINTVSPYQELLTNPQLLCWSCWFWLENGKQHFTTRGKVFATITDFLLRKLCYINNERILSGDLPSSGQKWQSLVAELAFTQAKQEQTSLLQTSPEIKRLEQAAKQLKLPPHEALSTLMQCDSSMTSTGEQLIFQFVHESHFCYLAARHLHSITLPNIKLAVSILLKHVKPERCKRILLFLVSLLYSDPSNVPERIVNSIIILARQFVTFCDIRYFLDVVEESGYDPHLCSKLGENIPKKEGEMAGQQLQKTTVGEQQKFTGLLWLRPKELQREKALLPLLKQARPARLWLRLCHGPHNDDLNPVSGHKAAESNLESALKILSNAYKRRNLPGLIVSDCTDFSPSAWPECIWWLSLERCSIHRQIPMPGSLMKLKLQYCSNIGNIQMGGCHRMKNLEIKYCKMTNAPQLPPCLQRLSIIRCDQIDKLSLPSTLKSLTVYDFQLPALPRGLRKLTIRLADMKGDSYTIQLICQSLIMKVKEALDKVSSLQNLSITNLILCHSDLLRLKAELQLMCPKCQIFVRNRDAFYDGWGSISASMDTFLLPSVA